jgi:hypothetical protein
MSNKPDLARGIYRVTHTLRVGPKEFVCVSDLIVIDGKPFVVLEWEDKSGRPQLTLPLDGALLSPPSSDGYCVYSGPALIDPRRVH